MPITHYNERPIDVIDYGLGDVYQIDIKLKKGDCPQGFSLDNNLEQILECMGSCKGTYFTARIVGEDIVYGSLVNQEQKIASKITPDFAMKNGIKTTEDFLNHLSSIGYELPSIQGGHHHDVIINGEYAGIVFNKCEYHAIEKDSNFRKGRKEEIEFVERNLQILKAQAREANRTDYERVGMPVVEVRIIPAPPLIGNN